MTAKPVVPRALAVCDAEEALDYYRFVDALQKAYAHIGRFPGAGCPRYAHELELPGLRCWPLHGFPHLVFYVERPDAVDVWRVLHGERDIPAWMRNTAEP